MDSQQNSNRSSSEPSVSFDPASHPDVAPVERSISSVDRGARGFTPTAIAAGVAAVLVICSFAGALIFRSQDGSKGDRSSAMSMETPLNPALAPPTADELTPDQVAAIQKAIQQQNDATEAEPPRDLPQ